MSRISRGNEAKLFQSGGAVTISEAMLGVEERGIAAGSEVVVALVFGGVVTRSEAMVVLV